MLCNLFFDLIVEKDPYFVSGAYLVRTRALLDELDHGQIYAGRGGQNWQLLLPITHKYACGFLDDVLYYIVARDSSHSRSVKEFSGFIAQSVEHETILSETIKRLKIDEAEKQVLLATIKEKYTKKRYKLSLNANDIKSIRTNYKEMIKYGLVDYPSRIDYWKRRCVVVYYLLRIVHLPVGLMQRIAKRR